MNIKLKEQQTELIKVYCNTNSNSFNFEVWAGAVKAQMMAALEKRNSRRQTK